jgi:hypothetical protein
LDTAAVYQVQDLYDALRIKVHKNLELWERLIFAVVLGTFVGDFSFKLFGWWSIMLAVLTAIAVFTLENGMNAQLYATKVEFLTTGNIGRRGSRTELMVLAADVQWLEFRDPPGRRSGLYAVTARKGHCVLPFLDYAQTMEVIRRIENKFPGMAERWRENSLSNSDSILKTLSGLF